MQGIIRGLQGSDGLLFQEDGKSEEELLFLASINAPRFRLGKAADDDGVEKFGYEAREWLRLLVIGKRVNCRVINEGGGRKYVDVTLAEGNYTGYSVNEALVREGLAKVHKGAARQAQVDLYFSRLTKAEDEARECERFIYGQDKYPDDEKVINIFNQVSITDEILDNNKGTMMPAVVEGVVSPTLYRLFFPSKKKGRPHTVVMCYLMGINSNTQMYPELQQFEEEAKIWTHNNLHQRDVRFVPLTVNKLNGQLGGILYLNRTKNVGEDLVRQGWVQLMENVIRDTPKLKSLYDAKSKAQEEHNGIYQSYTESVQVPVATFEGSLIEVVNGECMIISQHEVGTPLETGIIHRVYLASIRAPRLGTAKREADPYAEEARQCLHKACEGHRLKVRIEFIKPTPEGLLSANITGPGAPDKDMKCGSVFVGNKNVAVEMLCTGLVSVPYMSANASTEVGFDRRQYLKFEATAKEASLGVHSTTRPQIFAKPSDLTGPDASVAKSKRFEYSMTKERTISAIVQYVYNPGRYKVKIPSLNIICNIVLSNISCAQNARPAMRGMKAKSADPCHIEALIYTKATVLHRQVTLSVKQCDRGGNFLASLSVPGIPDMTSDLIKKGYAYITAEFRADEKQLSLQKIAREQEVGMWGDEEFRTARSETKEVATHTESTTPEVVTPPVSINQASVIHVNTLSDFYVVEDTDAAAKALETLQEKVQTYAQGNHNSSKPFRPTMNATCLAIFIDDSKWYRAKVLKVDRKMQTAYVMFIDFGNNQVTSFKNLMMIPSFIDTRSIPPFAKNFRLAGCADKNEIKDDAATSLFDLTTSPPYNIKVYHGALNVPPLVTIQDTTGKYINVDVLKTGYAVLSNKRIPENVPDEFRTEMKRASEYASTNRRGIYSYRHGLIESDESFDLDDNY